MLRLLLILTLLSSFTFADEVDHAELVKVLADKELRVSLPEINFGYGKFFSIDKVCFSNSDKETIEPIVDKAINYGVVDILLKKQISGHHFGCKTWILVNSKRECRQWGQKIYRILTEYRIVAHKDNKVERVMDYELPLCKEVE